MELLAGNPGKERNMSIEIEPGVMAATHVACPSLRFVERDVPAPEHGEGISRKVRILKQLWLPTDWTRYEEEWRDVPLSAG